MSQTTHVYRNEKNGKLGELTEEVAAIWPDLLTLVEDAVDEDEFVEPTSTPVIKKDDAKLGGAPTIEEKD